MNDRWIEDPHAPPDHNGFRPMRPWISTGIAWGGCLIIAFATYAGVRRERAAPAPPRESIWVTQGPCTKDDVQLVESPDGESVVILPEQCMPKAEGP